MNPDLSTSRAALGGMPSPRKILMGLAVALGLALVAPLPVAAETAAQGEFQLAQRYDGRHSDWESRNLRRDRHNEWESRRMGRGRHGERESRREHRRERRYSRRELAHACRSDRRFRRDNRGLCARIEDRGFRGPRRGSCVTIGPVQICE